MRIPVRLKAAFASTSLATALCLAPVALGTLGCGPSSAPKTAKVVVGDLPEGGDWLGVYYSELYGNLHLVPDGSGINGKWLRPVKDRWGELHGNITGDVIRFEWKEYVIGAVGPSSTRTGRGYFKYVRPEGDNVDDRIEGEIGPGADEVGEPWDAIKQRQVVPDLASIGGTGSQDLGGGDWDKDNSEGGSPEPPSPP